MKSKLFILLLLSITAHASRVEPPTEGECRYQNLSTRKHVPQTGACTFESYESVHVFTPGQGLSAAGGFRFKLANGREISADYEARMPSRAGEENGEWKLSNHTLNNLPAKQTSPDGWTCLRSAKEELCWKQSYPGVPD